MYFQCIIHMYFKEWLDKQPVIRLYNGILPDHKKDWFIYLSIYVKTRMALTSIMKKMKLLSTQHTVVSDSLQPRGLWPTRLLCPWNSPGKNTAVDSHSLLQGIFLTQGLNPGLLHCRQILYYLSCHGSTQSSCSASHSDIAGLWPSSIWSKMAHLHDVIMQPEGGRGEERSRIHHPL